MSRASSKVTFTIEGTAEKLHGTGYHDHNWGNIAPRKVLDHWYWGRARLGEYTLVTLLFVCAEAHDYQPVPVVMLAKDGAVVVNALGPDLVLFDEAEHRPTSTTGVPVARMLTYGVELDGTTYAITFEHERDGFFLDFGDKGAYHRLLGDVHLEIRTSDDDVEHRTGNTMWELLYFGDRSELTGQPEPHAQAHTGI